MKLELFIGAGCLAYGLAARSFGGCVVGLFFLFVVAVEYVPRFVKREVALWRSVVRHETPDGPLARVHDRRLG